MDVVHSPALQFSVIGCDKIRKKSNYFLGFSKRFNRECIIRRNEFSDLRRKSLLSLQRRRLHLGVSNACAPTMPSENLYAPFDENWLMKKKGQEVTSHLNGRSIFLVGMMGSGKTTVGKILSEALSYTFVDSDKYVEQALGGISVAHIFQQYGENFFRDFESEALRKLSLVPQQVVATGGGAAVRPVNRKYMSQGITVFLDAPLDALARRIAAVGTDSRPLLHFDSGDPYTKAFMVLFTLSKKRVQAYSDADVTISLTHLANNLGIEDLSDLGPAAIAFEVLVQIQNYLQDNNSKSIQTFS